MLLMDVVEVLLIVSHLEEYKCLIDINKFLVANWNS